MPMGVILTVPSPCIRHLSYEAIRMSLVQPLSAYSTGDILSEKYLTESSLSSDLSEIITINDSCCRTLILG